MAEPQQVTRADFEQLRRLLLQVLAATQHNSADVGAVMTTSTALTTATTSLAASVAALTLLMDKIVEGVSTQEEQLAELKAIREQMEIIVGELE